MAWQVSDFAGAGHRFFRRGLLAKFEARGLEYFVGFGTRILFGFITKKPDGVGLYGNEIGEGERGEVRLNT